MRYTITLTILALTGTLSTGCGGMEDDLLEALRAEEHVPLRVQPSLLGVDAFEAQDGKRYVAKAGDFSFMGSGSSVNALDRLQAKGYVADESVTLPQTYASTFEAWEITPKGAKYFQPDAFGTGIDVCLGKKLATEILEYTEPGKGGPPMTQARFRYKISYNDLVADLKLGDALKEEVSRAWPGEGMATYTKTNKGWRLELAMWQ